MKRVLVDYKKMTREVMSLLVKAYPDGYADGELISFTNAKKETVEAVEVRSKDTIFLVKVNKQLANAMAKFMKTEDKTLNNVKKLDIRRDDELSA